MEAGLTPTCWLLLTLFLNGILAGDWSVNLPSSPICAVIGSSVVLPCSYDYPQSSNESGGEGLLPAETAMKDGGVQQYKVLSEMWCLESSRCITQRYVFHSAGIFPDPSYQSRVEYQGTPGTKNCSLKISDLRRSDSGTYVFYVITNHPTQKMPEQRGVQLLVADSAGAVTVASGPSGDVTEGEALRLSCCVPEVDPDARFKWFKSTSATPTHTGPVWSIGKVTSGDSGSYYCQLRTKDTVQNSTLLVLDVQYSPQIIAVSASPAEEPLPVTLTCSSDANPPVLTFTWYQDAACEPSVDLSVHQGRRSTATSTGGRHTLSSVNVTADGSGLHCCVARNKHGSQKRTVTFRRSAATTTTSSRGKMVLIGVTIAVLLAIIVIIAFFMSRRQKSSRHQSYVLTETTSTAP